MPGICGFCSASADERASGLLTRMAEQLTSPWTKVTGHSLDPHGRFGLAHASLGIASTATQPASMPGDKRQAVLDGEIYASPSPSTLTGAAAAVQRADD